MGPSNVALVKLYFADQKVREAQGRLDAISKNVRIQQRKVADIDERLKTAQARLREHQTAAAGHELDLKSRDAHIEKLRLQQQATTNNREYQAFLLEISTEKVDKAKIEELALTAMQQAETQAAEVADLTQQQKAEKEKLAGLQNEIDERVKSIQAEIDEFLPARQEALEAVPQRYRYVYERLADRFEGEALSALSKPDRRREEYICFSCHMDLVADMYNKLHTRDDVVCCTSCGRILYIPDDLPPETAVNTKPKKAPKKEKEEPAAKG